MSEETTTGNNPELIQDASFQKVLEEQSYKKQFDRLSYKLFGDFFDKYGTNHFQWVDTNLAAANRGDDLDLYLARSLLMSMIIGGLGLFVGGLFAIILQLSGILPAFDTGLRYPEPLAKFLWVIRPLLFVVVFGGITYLIFTGISFLGTLYYPSYKAGIRKRRIDHTLPHAVTFMYALSKGGMDFIEVLNNLAEAEGTYGEVAKEIQQIVKEMRIFNKGLPQALNRASQKTPSTKFEDFCDDLRGILESGANTTDFLEGKSEEYRQDAKQEQESFLATLELLGEVYVTAFVAGPLFMIIITVILALMGGGGTMQLYVIVYAILPLMNIVYFVFLNTITTDEGHLTAILDQDELTHVPLDELEQRIEAVGGDERLEYIYNVRKKEEQQKFLRHPLRMMSEKPEYAFLVSGPLAVLAFIIPYIMGLSAPLFQWYVEDPIINTMYTFVIPYIILMTPYTFLYELKARRQKRLMSRFPDALKRLASANSIGMTLKEALEQVAENTSGRMGEEFMMIKNEIQWKNNVKYALVNFANRIRVQIVARTVKLLTEAAESTGDVENVLEVAAKDVSVKYRLQKKQAQNMMMYTVVILISFFVYVFVIVLLDTTFLERVSGEEFSAGEDLPSGGGGGSGQMPGGMGGMGGGMSISMSDVPVQKFRMVFYHSTIVQSIGSGILAGQLGSNDPKKGLKYSIILMIISTLVFYAFTSGAIGGIA